MAPGDTARLYHELTSYSPERECTAPVRDHRVLQDFVPNDFERRPAPCKPTRRASRWWSAARLAGGHGTRDR